MNHQGHDCIEIDKQADMCKTKLEKICDNTDGLIHQVKQAMDKTKCEAQQAETAIDEMRDNVQSTFKIMHDKLDEEEKKMLSDLQEARRRMKKTVDVIADSQMMTLATMESLKSCQVKLSNKNDAYDYVTVTESIERDLENQSQDLPCFLWSSKFTKNNETGELVEGRVEIKESELVQKKLEEVGRIRLNNQDKGGVLGMVVYKERVYVVHLTGLVVYCYKHDGSLSEKYEHEGGEETTVQGMCLMMSGGRYMLVVSDMSNCAVTWLNIREDFTLSHHRTQQVDYAPLRSFNDRGDLMVSDSGNHKIHRYTGEGQTLSVIMLPGDVNPSGVTRNRDGGDYVVRDWKNHQVVVINIDGQVQTRYKDEIHGVKLDHPFDITTDKQGRILIADKKQHHILLMSRKNDEVKQLIHGQMVTPGCLCLDEENHKIYVSARDMDKEWVVFMYDYILLTCNKTLSEKITKLEMVTVM